MSFCLRKPALLLVSAALFLALFVAPMAGFALESEEGHPTELPTPETDSPEASSSLKAQIARELVAFAPSFQGDPRLDAVSAHLSARARSELTSYSGDVVDAWLHREVYGLLFNRANSSSVPEDDMTRSEKMLSVAADHLALSFSETGRDLVGQVQESAWQGEPGQAFTGLEGELREDVIAALIDSGEAMARASGIAALANMEFKYELMHGDLSQLSLLTVQPIRSSPDKRHNTFWQGSWYHGESPDFSDGVVRNTINLGLGYRYMTPNEKHLYGVNLFYDHEFPYDHQRMSLGVEYLNSLIGLRMNRYFSLSGYRSRDDGYQERALGGWDAEVSGRLPQIPSVEMFLRGYTWERKPTEFINPEGTDIWGKELRMEYTPVPAFTVEAGLQDENDGEGLQANLGARFNYRLGADWRPQLTPTDSFELQSMAEERFQKVRRQNLIRKQIRIDPDLIAEVISITGTLTITPDSEPPFAASVGDRVAFDSELAVSGGVGDIAELLFGDGGFLRIGEGTTVAFRQGELELLTAGFLQYISGSTNVTLLSAGDSVSLLGTDVELRRDGDDTTLRVRDGAALITNIAGTLTLNVQEMGFVDDSAAPVLVTRGNAAHDTHVTDAVNEMNLTPSSIASPNLAPYVPSAVTITGTAQVGQVIDFTVPTTRTVNVTGTPELVIDVGGTERRATYQSGSGSTSLLFQYTILAGDSGATNIDASYIDYVPGSDIRSAQNRRLVPDVTGTRAVTISIPPGALSMTMDPTLGTDGTTATQVLIPTGTGTFNYDITWNQGSNNGSATGLTGDHTINLPGSGPVTVNITGQFPHMNSSGFRIGVTDVNQWGTNAWGSMASMFENETGITIFSASDVPDLSGVSSVFSMFRGANSFNHDISSWDVSNVIQFGRLFLDASAFNQDISGWDVSSAQFMNQMFSNADSFNQDLNTWNVSNVTTIGGIFQNNGAFNGDISSWDVSNVQTMGEAFRQATAFNQDISGWDVGNVTTMFRLFRDATSFNQNLGSWNLGSVTNIGEMLNNTALSRTHYDATLIGWAN